MPFTRDTASEYSARTYNQSTPPQQRTTTGAKSRLARAFGSPQGSRNWSVTSPRSADGGGGQARKAEARALETQRAQDAAKNRQIQLTLKRQRKRQAGLMKRARKSVARSGKGERARIKERGVKMAGAGEQELISRGLGSTTIRAGFQRGVRTDTQRLMTEQRDLQSQRMAGLFSREAGMQIPQGQLGLQGIGMQGGGLADYAKLLMMLQGGLS